jgi:tetratricopeptide (TPR) repeat protein
MSSDATHSLQLELERAQALIGLGRFDEAGSRLRELLAGEPNVAPAWCLLSQAQIGLGQTEGGLDAAERAAALAPEDDWPHRLRSLALLQLDDLDGAVAAAREAVALGPHNWQTHRRLAVALGAAKRDLDDALAAGERAVALAPNEPEAHFALGLVHHARKKRKQADQCFEHALALDPQHGPSRSALARRQLVGSRFGRAGKLADAAAGFRDVLQADPQADYAARNLELVLRVFIARVSYLVFLIVWIASRATGGTVGDRLVPLVLLAVPAAFAVRFLNRLAPDLRRQVGYVAFHGRLAAASYAQTLAIALLFVSAVTPSGIRKGIVIAAFVLSLGARLLLARRLGGLRFSAATRWIIVAAVASTVLFLAGMKVGGGFHPARGLAFVLIGGFLGLCVYLIRRYRRT